MQRAAFSACIAFILWGICTSAWSQCSVTPTVVQGTQVMFQDWSPPSDCINFVYYHGDGSYASVGKDYRRQCVRCGTQGEPSGTEPCTGTPVWENVKTGQSLGNVIWCEVVEGQLKCIDGDYGQQQSKYQCQCQ